MLASYLDSVGVRDTQLASWNHLCANATKYNISSELDISVSLLKHNIILFEVLMHIYREIS